ncbi:glutathione s-transferase, partial [Plakobranchus ocellatus]
MAKAQEKDRDIQAFPTAITGLHIVPYQIHNSTLLYDVSTGLPRPLVPQTFQRQVFQSIHNLAHPSCKLTVRGEYSCENNLGLAVAKYQLIYFQVRGRGEAIRYLLEDNGIDYEEINCGPRENWFKEYKPKMAFGQVPCLKDNDLMLVQSNAILRYLARKHGLYGNTEEEATFIDILNDGVEDLRKTYTMMIYKNYEAGKDDFIASLPEQLQYME